MRASLFKVNIDHEGESTIIFKVPLSELAEAANLLTLLQKEIELTFKEVIPVIAQPSGPIPEAEPIL